MQGKSCVIITMMTFIDTCVGELDGVFPASLGAASFFVVLFFFLVIHSFVPLMFFC